MSTIIETDVFEEELHEILEAQYAYQYEVKNSTAQERIEKLNKFKAAIIRHKVDVVNAVYNDFQRPKAASYIFEITALINQIDYTVKHLAEWLQPDKITPTAATSENPYTAEVIHEAKGVILIIGPWNVPFYLTLYPLVSAIAGGNTAVIKPSELTEHTSKVIRSVIEETFDKKEVAVVEGGVEETTHLLAQRFDHIYFTGSPKVAKIVMKAAAVHLTSVTLELGGKAPAVIDANMDMNKAAYRIIKGKTLNAGQICMDVDYVLVPTNKKVEFIEIANNFLKDAYGKESFNYDDYDQIINQANFDRIQRLFDDAISKGAKVVAGGEFNHSLRKIQPTILTDVPVDAAIMKEEIFGPLLPVLTYDSTEEALEIIRNLEKPLGLYIFSNDHTFIQNILRETTSGGVTVNDVMSQAFDPALPFGGVGQSGMGKGYGIHGFLELTNVRTVLFTASQAPNDEFLRAPFAGKEEILRDMFK